MSGSGMPEHKPASWEESPNWIIDFKALRTSERGSADSYAVMQTHCQSVWSKASWYPLEISRTLTHHPHCSCVRPERGPKHLHFFFVCLFLRN